MCPPRVSHQAKARAKTKRLSKMISSTAAFMKAAQGPEALEQLDQLDAGCWIMVSSCPVSDEVGKSSVDM